MNDTCLMSLHPYHGDANTYLYYTADHKVLSLCTKIQTHRDFQASNQIRQLGGEKFAADSNLWILLYKHIH